jgi:single-strand DNA-binding protein
MSGSLNKVILIGNLGNDPEIRNTNDGREIANFSLATSESWKDKVTGEKKEKTEWHRIVCFNEGLVKIIKEYVKKGTKLYIEGQLQTRKWLDNTNQEKYTTEVVLQGYNANLILLGTGNNSMDQSKQSTTPSNNPVFENDELDDNIPF